MDKTVLSHRGNIIPKCSSKSRICLHCYRKYIPRKFTASKEELEKYIKNFTLSINKIAKIFNTNDNSIRRRCKYLNIDISNRNPSMV